MGPKKESLKPTRGLYSFEKTLYMDKVTPSQGHQISMKSVPPWKTLYFKNASHRISDKKKKINLIREKLGFLSSKNDNKNTKNNGKSSSSNINEQSRNNFRVTSLKDKLKAISLVAKINNNIERRVNKLGFFSSLLMGKENSEAIKSLHNMKHQADTFKDIEN